MVPSRQGVVKARVSGANLGTIQARAAAMTMRIAIAPFRRLVVYPAIIRKMQSAWAKRYGGETGVETRQFS